MDDKSKVNGQALIWMSGMMSGSLGVSGGLVELAGNADRIVIQFVAIRELGETTHKPVEFRCSPETHVTKALMPELFEMSP